MTMTDTQTRPAVEPGKARLLHTMLRVKDLDKSLHFYNELLGMKLLRKRDYPSGKFTLAFVGYGDETDEAIRLPLKQELALIKQHRSANQDVIIIDDARLWVDGPFQAIREDLVPLCMPSERGVEFIAELFNASHTLTVVTDHEGYIVLTPK